MRRRDFMLDGLRLAAATAFAPLSLPLTGNARAAAVEVGLARLEGQGRTAHWRALDACPGDACAAHARIRIGIQSLAFPQAFLAAGIDVLFATAAGEHPFRMASFQRDAVSPLSKPFAFEADPDGVLGLRIRHQLQGSGAAMSELRWLDAQRMHLAPGRYLLRISPAPERMGWDEIAIAEAGCPLRLRDGRQPTFAHIAFEVTALPA